MAQTGSSNVIENTSSPIAPRFKRETMRGSKRVFSVSKYDGNIFKKQMVSPSLIDCVGVSQLTG
jgi:hypothetical protein